MHCIACHKGIIGPWPVPSLVMRTMTIVGIVAKIRSTVDVVTVRAVGPVAMIVEAHPRHVELGPMVKQGMPRKVAAP